MAKPDEKKPVQPTTTPKADDAADDTAKVALSVERGLHDRVKKAHEAKCKEAGIRFSLTQFYTACVEKGVAVMEQTKLAKL